jgi:hypothetical protein
MSPISRASRGKILKLEKVAHEFPGALGNHHAVRLCNDIDETVLPGLTHETLKELGVASVGHRVKLLEAIAVLRSDVPEERQISTSVQWVNVCLGQGAKY